MNEDELQRFASDYYIPLEVYPVLPGPNDTIADFPPGKVGVYTRFFDYANIRFPISVFLNNVLVYYSIHISQLHPLGAAKVSNFEVNCHLLDIQPTVHLFRAFYHTTWANGWVTFAKRKGALQCYTKRVDSLRKWREKFFWVDSVVFPHEFGFYTRNSLPPDECPLEGWYNMDHATTIDANRIPINAYPEEFLVHLGMSRNYFAPAHEVPTFLAADSTGGYSSFALTVIVA